MGSSFKKDENITVNMDLDRPYYVAGDIVNGCSYLEARANSQYNAMQIVISGQEYVYWSEGSGKNRRTYRNRYQSYNSSFTLHNFQGQVPLGQYSFPFTFPLPNMMCGSFTYSSNCYIQYTIISRLAHQKLNDSQICAAFLNILQPPRSPFGAITSTQATHAKCCGCCADYGLTTITLNSSKNFLVTGDSFFVNGKIDHSAAKQPIKEGRIMLQQRRVMISSGGRVRSHVDYQHPLQGINRTIEPGQVYDFNFESQIPNSIINYTAIGRVTARYFVIHVETDYGCCANTAFATLHIIVHSKTPMVSANKKTPKPANWYPQQFPLVVCNQMKPYIYTPLAGIPMLNMPNQKNNQAYIPPQQNFYANYQPNYQPYHDPYYNNEGDYGQNTQGQQPYFNNETNQVYKKL